MSLAKLALGASAAAIALSACGTAVHPSSATGVSRGRVDDPRTARSNHVSCIRSNRLPVHEVGAARLQIGPAPSGASVVFEATPGIAQGLQIEGAAQGAEVIGSALLYPNRTPDSELKTIEDCLAKGVTG